MRHSYRSALVTGASSGIGASFARLLAADGCDLVLVARREDRLDQLADELRQQHDVDVEVLSADLGSPEGLAAVTARLTEGEPIELLVNNAARSARGSLAELTPETIDAQIRLNVTALTQLARAAVTGMLARGYGGILNVSSMASVTASPGSAVYAATKAAVRMLSEGLRQEVKPYNIRTTVISPGAVATELPDSVTDPGAAARIQKFYADFAIPADSFARAVVFAMNQPDDVDINEILFRPTRQEV